MLNGTRLAEIHNDFVVLERGRESIRLYVQGKIPQAGASLKSPLLQVGGGQVSSNAPPVSPPGTDDARTAAVTTYIRPSPVFQENQLRGFVLLPGAQPAMFSKLGLQSGDVLTQINGAAVTDSEQVLDMLEQLTSGAAIDVALERKEQVRRLVLDGSLITAQH